MNHKRNNPIRPLLLCATAMLLILFWISGCGEDRTTSRPVTPDGGSPGNSAASAPPPAPDRLSASVSEEDVALSWHAVKGATSYTVYRATLPGVDPGQAEAIAVQQAHYTDAGVRQEVSFYYVVTASNARGEGPPSPEVAAKARSAVPGTPFQVTVVNGDGKVTLSWPDASGAESYALYFSTEPGVSKETATRIAPVSSPFTHAPLANGTTYYYALAGINAGGNESPLSSEVAARPMPPPLTAPTGLSAAAGDGRVTLTWNPVVGAEGYALYWSLSPGVTTETGTRLPVDASPYEHTGLVNGAAHYYVLVAVNAFEESDPTAEVSATPEAVEQLPDLIVESLEVLSFSSTSIAYRYTITNIGEGVAWLDGPTDVQYDNVSVQAFVSSDEVFGNTGDIAAGGTILGLSPLGGLYPGESFTGQFSSSTPINLVTHPFLTLKVDWGKVVEESNEDNNTLAVSIQAQAPVPEPPGNVTAEAGDGTVTVQWSPVAGAYGYNLYWSTAPGVTPSSGIPISNVTSPFTHMGLDNGTTYHYVVTASSSGGESTVSAEVSATPQAPGDPGGTWQTLTPMPTGRYAATGATVDGMIYVIGGTSDGYDTLDVMERYDPITNTWSTRAPKPMVARGGLGSAVVGGKIYAFGGGWGYYLHAMEMYDPATDTWQSRSSMPTARAMFVTEVVNGKIYAIGGYNGQYLGTVEIYDPVTNTWSYGATMPTKRYGAAASVVAGRIYVIGGRDGVAYTSTVEVYDPAANAWSTRAPMPTGRYGLTSQAVNGKIYAIGGWASGGGYFDVIDVYDPLADTWTTTTPMPTPRAFPVSGTVNGKIYVIGGRDQSRYDVDAVEVFTPGGP